MDIFLFREFSGGRGQRNSVFLWLNLPRLPGVVAGLVYFLKFLVFRFLSFHDK